MILINTPMLASAYLLSVGTLGAMFFLHRSLRHWRGRCRALAADLDLLREDVKRVAASSARVSREVSKVRHECTEVQDRMAQGQRRATSSPLNEIVDSGRRGSADARLAQLVGLSRGEAELVTRMQGARRG